MVLITCAVDPTHFKFPVDDRLPKSYRNMRLQITIIFSIDSSGYYFLNELLCL